MSMTEMMRGKSMPADKKNDIKLAQHDFANVRMVQIGCVLDVLAEAIERVKISLIMPKLLEHPTHMAQVLNGTKFEKAVHLVESFVRRREFILREKRPPLMDHGIIQIIDFFQRNHKMYHLFPSYYNHMSDNEKKLLKAFQMLYDLAKDRLYRTSTDAIAQERQLHAMYKRNEVVKEQVEVMRQKIEEQKAAIRTRMAAKEAYLQNYEDLLLKKKREKNERIQKEIDRCTRLVRANKKSSMERQADLEEQLQKTRSNYATSTNTYLKQEKVFREEKNKLILQLQAIIKKYDHSIGEKMVENLQLTDEHKKAKKALDEYMVGFRKVERVYKQIVVKREEEEARRRQHRVLVFAMNRAATKIQKYWRKWKKHMRRKNRRNKKG
ncbi:dynein regulatory complex protein 10 isoform X1 [Drosophila biarmipes]|uniref:dynein regulatory complex protein 10 isoform X1 n=1 Tax=Drosophila biarmipes TaxID=125945 RepID=UPI0007E61816|nr:dynein regulatory complex protein 10 isoform X1 [Drosophila biarmipes]